MFFIDSYQSDKIWFEKQISRETDSGNLATKVKRRYTARKEGLET